MNPPEKIHVIFADGGIHLVSDKIGTEYHLAPIWHDAKEPPEEDGKYVVEYVGKKYAVISFWNDGINRRWEGVIRYFRLPLPQPPDKHTIEVDLDGAVFPQQSKEE